MTYLVYRDGVVVQTRHGQENSINLDPKVPEILRSAMFPKPKLLKLLLMLFFSCDALAWRFLQALEATPIFIDHFARSAQLVVFVLQHELQFLLMESEHVVHRFKLEVVFVEPSSSITHSPSALKSC